MSDTPELRPERAQELRDIFAVQAVPARRRTIGLPALLVLVCAVLISSMPLAWHHHYDAQGDVYTTVYGIRSAPWMVALAAGVVGVVARLVVRPVGSLIVVGVGTLGFFGLLGMCVDAIDNSAHAANLGVAAYDGPGFWVGWAGTAGLLSAVGLAWRERP